MNESRMTTARILLGWLTDEEAASYLDGSATENERNLLISQCQQKRAALAPRTHVEPGVARINRKDLLVTNSERDDVISHYFSQHDYSIEVVDLRKVIAYQHFVRIDGFDERKSNINFTSASELMEFCLPLKQQPTPDLVHVDLDGQGYAITSPNPNLRFEDARAENVQLQSPLGKQTQDALQIAFVLSMGASFINVAEFNGRTFLRDGYHRAALLVQQGIYQIPCVYIRAKSMDEIGAGEAHMFNQETLFGDNPPFVTDYWDEEVSGSIALKRIQRIVRLRFDEFVVEG
jgi:hypothetical protein